MNFITYMGSYTIEQLVSGEEDSFVVMMVITENTEKETRKLDTFSSKVLKLEGKCPYETIANWKSVKRLSLF